MEASGWHSPTIGVGGPRKGMPVGARSKDNALQKASFDGE